MTSHADTSAWSRGLRSLCADACAVLLRPRGMSFHRNQHERVTSPYVARWALSSLNYRGSGHRLFPALFPVSDWRASSSRCAIGHLGFSFPWPGVATCFPFHKLVHKVSHHQSDRLERHRINLLSCAVSDEKQRSEGGFASEQEPFAPEARNYD